jgi:putative oxidoreductase
MTTIRTRVDLGLLVLRVATGLVFLMHGYQKVFTYGLAGVGAGFEKMGIPMPMVMGPAIGILELVGGIALMIGLFTRAAAFLLACDMLGAMFLVHLKGGFFLPTGYEFVLILAAACAALALGGAGDMSIDAKMHRKAASP